MKNIINNHIKSDKWKIQLISAINFISSKDIDEERSKNDNIKIIIYDKADEVIKEIFESLLSRYQIGLETLMKLIEFFLDYVYLLYCKYHQANLNPGRSYIDSLD